MSFANWLTVAALAMLPFTAVAQQKFQEADPTDAKAAVPAPAYQSVFKNYKAAADSEASPDKTWRAANDEMGKLGGHAGHMKDSPGASSAPAPARSMPADHGKHH